MDCLQAARPGALASSCSIEPAAEEAQYRAHALQKRERGRELGTQEIDFAALRGRSPNLCCLARTFLFGKNILFTP
jgi:hypothetical protein